VVYSIQSSGSSIFCRGRTSFVFGDTGAARVDKHSCGDSVTAVDADVTAMGAVIGPFISPIRANPETLSQAADRLVFRVKCGRR
jgi:hypothetical protein